MSGLELKVPPPVVALVAAAAMWLVAVLTPALAVPTSIRVSLAVAIALVGGAFSLAGVASFRKAKTTVNPMKPEKASSLVTSGIYKTTRNPMYVGLLLVLVAWGMFLSSVIALAGPVGFFFYIERFQIAPEERVLAKMFGPEYAEYQARVRRWL
jgi:protein-S-isoprenylcysteine O-methyltransferase Ste14